MGLELDIKNIRPFLSEDALQKALNLAEKARESLLSGSGAGADYLGWLDLPEKAPAGEEHARVLAAGEKVHKEGAALLCVGIGGSYLGAKALLEALAPGAPVYFLGQHLHPDVFHRTLEGLKDREVYVNVISKSGTTLEPALAFRLVKDWMHNKYGSGAAKRIFATTDANRGALRSLAKKEGYESFIIPDDVGGRFSVFTPVGLLPLAAAGVDVPALLKGAATQMQACRRLGGFDNLAMRYAAVRHGLHSEGGKDVEILAAWHPDLAFLGEWWKQLYGESEGKEGKGLFPASVVYTTDLHSLGQYVQEGQRKILETFLVVKESGVSLKPSLDADNLDGLNYLVDANLDMNEINHRAWAGTAAAHLDGGVPNQSLVMQRLDAENLGELLALYQFSVALSAYMLGVNPFDQPGVEAYKQAMFRLLGRPS